MAPSVTPEFGLPMALVSWQEFLLILIALLVFGLPILIRVMRVLRADEGRYR